MTPQAPDLFGYPRFWAECFGTAPFLPTSRAEMDALGWDSCDVIIVTGDAYVDHPSFGMAVIGRLLEAQGFRIGVIAQPDWRSPSAFELLQCPAHLLLRDPPHLPHEGGLTKSQVELPWTLKNLIFLSLYFHFLFLLLDL